MAERITSKNQRTSFIIEQQVFLHHLENARRMSARVSVLNSQLAALFEEVEVIKADVQDVIAMLECTADDFSRPNIGNVKLYSAK